VIVQEHQVQRKFLKLLGLKDQDKDPFGSLPSEAADTTASTVNTNRKQADGASVRQTYVVTEQSKAKLAKLSIQQTSKRRKDSNVIDNASRTEHDAMMGGSIRTTRSWTLDLHNVLTVIQVYSNSTLQIRNSEVAELLNFSPHQELRQDEHIVNPQIATWEAHAV
jgi:hypothetical protein